MDKEMTKDSKLLSYYLRHKPDEINCEIDKYGWVDVYQLCKNSKFTLSYLEAIVEQDTRYEFNRDKTKIRAFHGHSVKGIEPYIEFKPTMHLYHGTSTRFLPLIKESGEIKSMSRNYVHLSSDETKAKAIGSRHGKPVILVVDAVKASNDGIKFYDSGDDVALSENIPYKYVVDEIEL